MGSCKGRKNERQLLPAVLTTAQTEMKQHNKFKKNPSSLRELVMFIRENKKWYLIPIVISILLLGILIALGSTGAAPFIYTVF